MDAVSSSRSLFSSRIQGYQQLGKKAQANGTKEYCDKFDSVTNQMMGLIQSKEAVFHSDYDNNPIVSVPDVGSLKLTAKGCEMAILTHNVPFLSRLAFSLGSSTSRSQNTGTLVSLDEKAGRLDVSRLKGETHSNVVSPADSTACGIRESFTLDTNQQAVVDHQSQELDYQFADATFRVFQKRKEMENPTRPLFDRDGWR